jgi:hypothetical protein
MRGIAWNWLSSIALGMNVKGTAKRLFSIVIRSSEILWILGGSLMLPRSGNVSIHGFLIPGGFVKDEELLCARERNETRGWEKLH